MQPKCPEDSLHCLETGKMFFDEISTVAAITGAEFMLVYVYVNYHLCHVLTDFISREMLKYEIFLHIENLSLIYNTNYADNYYASVL